LLKLPLLDNSVFFFPFGTFFVWHALRFEGILPEAHVPFYLVQLFISFEPLHLSPLQSYSPSWLAFFSLLPFYSITWRFFPPQGGGFWCLLSLPFCSTRFFFLLVDSSSKAFFAFGAAAFSSPHSFCCLCRPCALVFYSCLDLTFPFCSTRSICVAVVWPSPLSCFYRRSVCHF